MRYLSGSPLGRPAFLRLWTGQLISYVGDQFTFIALLWFVLQLTSSSLALGTVLLSFALPRIITAPLWGKLLDSRPPRRLMLIDNLARAAFIAAIPGAHWLGMLSLPWIILMALCAGATSPATDVGVRVLVPRMVPDNELERANGLLGAAQQVSVLLGPVLAGALTAAAGAPVALMIDAASFVAMAAILFGLPDVAIARHAAPVSRGSFFRGFRAILEIKPVRVLTFLLFVLELSYFPLEPALPVYIKEVLHEGAGAYGLVWSAFGVGALLSYLGMGYLSRVNKAGIVAAVIAVLWGLAIFPLAILHSLPATLICFSLGGLVWGPYLPLEASLIQRLVPAERHGEVFGARSAILNVTNPLGILLGGALVGWAGAPAVLGLSALCVMGAGLIALASPSLRHLRRDAPRARIT